MGLRGGRTVNQEASQTPPVVTVVPLSKALNPASSFKRTVSVICAQ